MGGPGRILKTNNGGINWFPQTSNTNSFLRSVYFIDENIGWTVGANGKILKTTNGGINWIEQEGDTLIISMILLLQMQIMLGLFWCKETINTN